MSQFGRYISVGLVNTVAGYAVIFLCMYGLGVGPIYSNITGYGAGLLISYALNRSFTFRSTQAKGPEMIKFLLVFLVAYGANLVALKLMVDRGVPAGLAQVLAGGLYVTTGYVVNRNMVFR